MPVVVQERSACLLAHLASLGNVSGCPLSRPHSTLPHPAQTVPIRLGVLLSTIVNSSRTTADSQRQICSVVIMDLPALVLSRSSLRSGHSFKGPAKCVIYPITATASIVSSVCIDTVANSPRPTPSGPILLVESMSQRRSSTDGGDRVTWRVRPCGNPVVRFKHLVQRTGSVSERAKVGDRWEARLRWLDWGMRWDALSTMPIDGDQRTA